MALAVLAIAFVAVPARADVTRDRVNAAGYFRIMTRPDFQGGDSRLGYWNLYGRLLNEGPWGALELSLDVLPRTPASSDVWTTIHTKIEGGSFFNADSSMGWVGAFMVTQMYVQAGNILLDKVTWQLGTLDTYFGDLGLYDMKPAQVLYDTLGLSARYENGPLDLVVGFGDAGYALKSVRPSKADLLNFVGKVNYNTVATAAGTARLRLGGHLEIGAGGQGYYEPAVSGNRFAPHQTVLEGITYEDFYRHEIAERYIELDAGHAQAFPRPTPTSATSWKLVGYLGFGQAGPLRWSNLFASYGRKHPDDFVTESYQGANYTIYVKDWTDQRYTLLVGNEMQLQIIPDLLDASWAVLYGHDTNLDDTIAAGEDNRTYYSTVLRLQAYPTTTVHLLVESSVAREQSDNGFLWRQHFDSIFQNRAGTPDSRGLEFGDTALRETWQLKAGVVLNPMGTGIYMRPSLRLLYGVQYSNVQNAFGNNFATTLNDSDRFSQETRDRHWHHVLGVEAEAWF